jgi:Calcineurin-like phosphoesterase
MRILARLLVAVGCALLGAVVVSLPIPSAVASVPEGGYQGLWWNSPPESESGWGINLAHQGNVIFATWFTYDTAGDGWWLSMTAYKTAEGTYTGTLIEAGGPAFNSVPFDPAKVTRTPVGTGTLAFRDVDTGTFSYTVRGVSQTKYITRQAFGLLPTCAWGAAPDFAAATNYQDLWWVAGGSESGWGINLTHQGDDIFATWFTYDTDGTPLWLSVTAAKTGPGTYRGSLIRTTGPAFSAQPFDPAKVIRTTVGTATFTFANGNAATFEYTVNGVPQTKAITRQLFAPPAGTVCGEPYRPLSSFSVVASADIAECFGLSAAGSGAAKTAVLVTPKDSLVITAGDNAYDYGSPSEYAYCFDPTWGAFKDRLFPTIGNHDYYTPDAAGYFGYFGPRAGPDRRGYYSFDYGGWHFISLNSMMGTYPGSEQYLWLKADLEQSRDSLCTIALMHYPAFNSGLQYGSVVEMRPFFDLLYNAGVEMVLSGHDHLYERFAPQRADGVADPARGVRQFIVATGGHTLNPFGTPLPNSEFRYNSTWGIVRLTLGQGRYSWQLVPVGGGAPIDPGSATCHP